MVSMSGKIIINNRNYKKYDLEINKIGDFIYIPISELTKGSHALVDTKCDICGKKKEMEYRTYYKNTNGCTEKYYCQKCSKYKSEKTNLERYGSIYPQQNDIIKKKIVDTNLKRYGVEHSSQLDEYKEKQKNTNIKKYGFESVLQNKDFFNKGKNTMMKLYGCEYPIQNENIKNKIENTNIEKYGVKNVLQIGYIRKKAFNSLRNNMMKKNNILKVENDDFILNCDKNKEHDFSINKYLFYVRKKCKITICTICNPVKSYWNSEQENNLKEFIKQNYNKNIKINSKILPNNKELDIYLPDLKLAFEFNGVYWHNELYKSNNYHLEKTEMCEKQEIHLIHIYEDDWTYKQEIVKSRILNLLGVNNKIYARKCEIKEISDNKIIRDFLEKNHLQGFINSRIKIGLFYNDELVSLMTFGSQRRPMNQKSYKEVYEMLRFCNKLNTSVIGGADKLFKYFIKNYQPKEVISYADRSWSQGELYKNLNFLFVDKTLPNYYYVIGDKRFYRFNFRKDKLISEGFDPTKSEHEIMLERKIYRIYDSGSLKFSWKPK
jgi:hypothetical protein